MYTDTPSNDELQHYGVFGMRWGVHKNVKEAGLTRSKTTDLSIKTNGISVHDDGSMEIKKGASIQRLTRSSNNDRLNLKGLTYASLTDYDNAKYIKYIGGKGLFGGGRDQIIALSPTKQIKAPSTDDATKIVTDLFVNNDQFRKTFTDPFFDASISEKDISAMKKEPTGKVARDWYTLVNASLTFSPDFDANAPYIQKTVRESFEKKGFNAVRDENDFQSGVSKAPIIIFSPEKTLKITSVSTITDELRKASKDKVKTYNKLGKDWVEKNLYE